MLEQILNDMYVDPELLAELSDEQKEVLFCVIRQEQVRRYNNWQKELESGIDRSLVCSSKGQNTKHRQVHYLCEPNGDIVTYIINEDELEEMSAAKAHARAIASRRRRQTTAAFVKPPGKAITPDLTTPEEILRRLQEAGIDTNKLPSLAKKPNNVELLTRDTKPSPEAPKSPIHKVASDYRNHAYKHSVNNPTLSPTKNAPVITPGRKSSPPHTQPSLQTKYTEDFQSPQKRGALVFEPEVTFPRIEELKAKLQQTDVSAVPISIVEKGDSEVILRNRADDKATQRNGHSKVSRRVRHELIEAANPDNFLRQKVVTQQYRLDVADGRRQPDASDTESGTTEDCSSTEKLDTSGTDTEEEVDIVEAILEDTEGATGGSFVDDLDWIVNVRKRVKEEEDRKRQACLVARRSLHLDDEGYGGGEVAFHRRSSGGIAAHTTSEGIRKRQEAITQLHLEPSSQESVIDWIRKYETPRLLKEFSMPVYYDHWKPTGDEFRNVPSWFHGVIQRLYAERMLLRDSRDGSFLVRVSDSFLGFVISIFTNGLCYHCLISIVEPSVDQQFGFKTPAGYKLFGQADSTQFERLTDLVNYYSCHSLSTLDDQILLHPIGQSSVIPDYVSLFYPQPLNSVVTRF